MAQDAGSVITVNELLRLLDPTEQLLRHYPSLAAHLSSPLSANDRGVVENVIQKSEELKSFVWPSTSKKVTIVENDAVRAQQSPLAWTLVRSCVETAKSQGSKIYLLAYAPNAAGQQQSITPQGVLRAFIGQLVLLAVEEQPRLDLSFIGAAERSKIRSRDLGYLCTLFDTVVERFVGVGTVCCLLSGPLRSEDVRSERMKRVVDHLARCAEPNYFGMFGAFFKLIVTNPGTSLDDPGWFPNTIREIPLAPGSS